MTRRKRKPARPVSLDDLGPTGQGPTPEAMHHSAYEVIRTAQNVRAYVNQTSTPLQAARRRNAITERQYKAGLQFEAWTRATMICGGRRDTLDMSPRGQAHETEGAALHYVRNRQRIQAVQQLMDADTYWRLYSVIGLHEAIGDCRLAYIPFRRLVAGLDVVADYLKMEGE